MCYILTCYIIIYDQIKIKVYDAKQSLYIIEHDKKTPKGKH